MSRPTISVIIPTYNRVDYLKEAIQSVRAQTWRAVEMIIVDDGSTDATSELLLNDPTVIYLYQDHCGISAARNKGLLAASGDLIAFLDSDDLWLPEKLEKQVKALQIHPEIEMVFTHIQQFVSPELFSEDQQRFLGNDKIMPGIGASSMLIQKSVVERVGLFSTGVQIAEFLDWYARAVDIGIKSLVLDEVLVRRRLHSSNTGLILKDRRHEYLQAIKMKLDRTSGAVHGGQERRV